MDAFFFFFSPFGNVHLRGEHMTESKVNARTRNTLKRWRGRCYRGRRNSCGERDRVGVVALVFPAAVTVLNF